MKTKIPEFCENEWCDRPVAKNGDCFMRKEKPLEPLRNYNGYPVYLCDVCRDAVALIVGDIETYEAQAKEGNETKEEPADENKS